MITVAILEDDLMMQQRFAAILQGWDYVKMVFCASSNAEFGYILESHKVDVLLCDINVVDGTGLDSIRLFQRTVPGGLSIAISSLSNSDTVLSAIHAGAIGYLHKDDSSLEIVNAVRAVLRDESPISPSIAFRILKALPALVQPKSEPQERSEKAPLTDRELEIINLIAKGLSNDEVSNVLHLAKSTVPTHIRNIYRKLGANRRTEAVFEARQLGII